MTLAVVAATPPAAPAQPEPALAELDEVVVTAKTTIKLDDFVEFAQYDSVAISPSGTKLAIGWFDINSLTSGIRVFEFPSMKPIITQAVGPELMESTVYWASERRLLIPGQWPIRGLAKIREPLGMLRLMDPNGGNPHTINPEAMGDRLDPLPLLRREEESVATASRNLKLPTGKLNSKNAAGPVRVLSLHTGQPDQILFQTTRSNNRGGNTDGTGAYLLNLKDNKQTRLASLPINNGRFVTGKDFRIALASGTNANNEAVVYYLPEAARAQGSDWQLVTAASGTGRRGLQPVAWSGKGEEYFALDGRGNGTRSVVLWDAANNTQRVVYRHPEADIDNVALDAAGWPWMFSGIDHFPVYWYPDPQHPLAKLHRAIVQKVRDEVVEITSASDDLNTAVVKVTSGRRPPVFMVVNVKSASSMTSFFSFPTLRGTRLAQVDPIEFLSRDGIALRGYLTTPEDANGKARKNLPLIVMANNGPLDKPAGPGYEFERQLLASRGYAVLQINVRGSSGRGAAFERAGDRKWGREVQGDYEDGVRWAIKDGVADANRVCFYGTGYGAFSAMTAAARTPDLFKCVIGVGGVYDLPKLLGEGKKEIPAALQQVLGSDMKELEQRSPVNFASAIKAKVYLLPQDKDEYYSPDQSASMRTALKNAGNTASWDILGADRDGFMVTATRATAYDKMFRFLEQSIGK